MERIRQIIHLDLDAFFCSVEELRDTSLVGKPFAVGGRPNERGVVASCSYAARRYGIHSAMPMSQALRLCPQLIIISSRHGNYEDASQKVMAILRELTPQVEQISIDEAFLDVSDIPEKADIIAKRLQTRIKQETGLSCSIGVATSKLVAKIATDVGKKAKGGSGPPFAMTVVPPGSETEFLAPLPADFLWGVGPKTAARLAEMGIQTIGDIVSFPEYELIASFGKNGKEMIRHARGIDRSPIVTSYPAKSYSQEITFARDVKSDSELHKTLQELSRRVSSRLQDDNLSGMTIKLKLRWPNFTTITRQTTLNQITDDAQTIANIAQQLFEKVWKPGKAVRLLGVGISSLAPSVHQLTIWDVEDPQSQRLEDAINELQHRFGEGIISKGLPAQNPDINLSDSKLKSP
ncbi:MAG TPA: DNA polymerase IV [Anaerolineaceae bacterium]|nr:DNA polymerase IV [Anaerolineaceae bacterium]